MHHPLAVWFMEPVSGKVRLCRYFVKNYSVSMPIIHSLTRQLIPFAPTVLRSQRLRTTLFTIIAHSLHSTCYHNDSAPTLRFPWRSAYAINV